MKENEFLDIFTAILSQKERGTSKSNICDHEPSTSQFYSYISYYKCISRGWLIKIIDLLINLQTIHFCCIWGHWNVCMWCTSISWRHWSKVNFIHKKRWSTSKFCGQIQSFFANIVFRRFFDNGSCAAIWSFVQTRNL